MHVGQQWRTRFERREIPVVCEIPVVREGLLGAERYELSTSLRAEHLMRAEHVMRTEHVIACRGPLMRPRR